MLALLVFLSFTLGWTIDGEADAFVVYTTTDPLDGSDVRFAQHGPLLPGDARSVELELPGTVTGIALASYAVMVSDDGEPVPCTGCDNPPPLPQGVWVARSQLSEIVDPENAPTEPTEPEPEPCTTVALVVDVVASSEHPGYEAAAAVDGTDSIWHTEFEDADLPGTTDVPHPHTLLLDLGGGDLQRVCGLRYTPRQGGSANGTVAEYEIEAGVVLDEMALWVSGELLWPEGDRGPRVLAGDPVEARFVRLRSVSSLGGDPWTSAAEVEVLVQDVPPEPDHPPRVLRLEVEFEVEGDCPVTLREAVLWEDAP